MGGKCVRWLTGAAMAVLTAGGAGAAPPSVDIAVRLQLDPLSYDFSRDHRELKSLAQCERPGTSGKYLGLSRSSVSTRFSTRLAVRPMGEAYTGDVISMNVTLRLSGRTVYIASELPKGSCSFKETMAHEMRHVAVDEELARMFQARLRAALDDILPSVTGVLGSTPQDIKTTIEARLNHMLERELREMRVMRSDRQAEVDSADEYLRLEESCGGETRSLIMDTEADDPGWHAPVACPPS